MQDLTKKTLSLIGLFGFTICLILAFIYYLFAPRSSNFSETYTIEGKDLHIEFGNEYSTKNVYALRYAISGKNLGPVLIEFGKTDSTYQKPGIEISGYSYTRERIDWYADTCYVRITPIGKSKGELNIDLTLFSF